MRETIVVAALSNILDTVGDQFDGGLALSDLVLSAVSSFCGPVWPGMGGLLYPPIHLLDSHLDGQWLLGYMEPRKNGQGCLYPFTSLNKTTERNGRTIMRLWPSLGNL